MSNYFKHKIRSKSIGEIVGWVLLAIIGISALVILFGFIIMWLWNWLMPDLFGLSTITYWQGMGLCLLSKILFGGIGGGKGGGHKKHHDKHHYNSECRESSKNEISKWKFYDKFWEEQGNEAFNEYVAGKKSIPTEEE
ncbi:hypothetical protein [Crocinitomix catalasitica]|uniref:hypothetical protein n=1 Tax=Crocinitomix catalasitica TaxID=184607 RepID=UPI000907C6F8|nr:hypothetical protein [Crocinitomix catalasitica]